MCVSQGILLKSSTEISLLNKQDACDSLARPLMRLQSEAKQSWNGMEPRISNYVLGSDESER